MTILERSYELLRSLFFPNTFEDGQYLSISPYCTTETWSSASYFDCEIKPSGYLIYCKDRGSIGGWVLIAVDESLAIQEVPTPPHIDFVIVNLQLEKNMIICCIYVYVFQFYIYIP